MYFRTLVLSAFAIAIIAGAILSAYQAFFITPIIVGSEVYEVAEPVTHHQTEEGEAWAPEDGVERHSWNFASNFLLCFAYALILLSAMSIKTSVNIIKGIFWGGAAYLTVFVAPAIGLPPEIPGMEAAQLEGRQAWWLLTVILTAISLWLIAFQKNVYKVVGVILLIIPHILGAPQPELHGFANTDPAAVEALTGLWYDFILQTSIANALLWVIIGALSGFIANKYIYSIDDKGESHV
jgi:cobalt transporter subunit CbtA